MFPTETGRKKSKYSKNVYEINKKYRTHVETIKKLWKSLRGT